MIDTISTFLHDQERKKYKHHYMIRPTFSEKTEKPYFCKIFLIGTFHDRISRNPRAD